MKKFNLLAIIFFIFSFNLSFAENQTLEYKVSDCISVSDNRDLMTQIEDNGKCIDEISENNDLGDKNLATKKTLYESILSLIYPVVQVASTITAAIFGLFLLYKTMRKLAFDENMDVSSNVIGYAVLAFITAIGSNTGTLPFLTNKLFENTDNQITNFLAMNNVVQARSETAKQPLIDSNIKETAQAVQKLGYGIVNSEFCSLKYVQNQMSFFEYPTDRSFNDSKEMSCLSEKETEAKTMNFLERGGRSPLNYAVKKCSRVISSKDYDCGFVDGVESTSAIGALVNQYAPEFVEVAKNYDAELCEDLNIDALSRTDLKSYCREWNGDRFVLKSTEMTNSEIDSALIAINSTMMKNVSDAISKDLNKRVETDIALFNTFELANALVSSGIDEDLMQNELAALLSEINYTNPYIVDQTFGNELKAEYQSGSNISSLNGYYDRLNQNLRKIYTSDAMAEDTSMQILRVLRDPKTLFGRYTKEGFEIDAQPLKSIQDNYKSIGVMWIAGYTAGNYIFSRGKDLGDKAMMKVGTKLKSTSNGLLYTIVISFLFIPIVVFSKIVQILVQVFLKIVGLIGAVYAFIFKKDEPSQLFISFLDLKLIPVMIMSLTISLMLTSFFTAIWYDNLTALGLEAMQKDSLGLSIVKPFLFLLGYTILINLIFLSSYYATSSVIAKMIRFTKAIASIEMNEQAVNKGVKDINNVLGRFLR